MPTYEFACSECGVERTALLTYEEMKAIERSPVPCPGCDTVGTYSRSYSGKAPMGRMGGESSERSIESMQKSFKEHFLKSGEMDQIRHKHGVEFDDSLRGAAADRIRKENAGEPVSKN